MKPMVSDLFQKDLDSSELRSAWGDGIFQAQGLCRNFCTGVHGGWVRESFWDVKA